MRISSFRGRKIHLQPDRGGFRQVQKVCINLSNISDFLKQSIEINYQIHDYKNFRLSHLKLRKFRKKLKDSMLQVSLFPLHLSYIFAVPCDLYFLPPGWRTRLNSPINLSAFVNLISLNRSLIDVEPSTNCLFDILEEMRIIFGECHRKNVTSCSAHIEFRFFVQLKDKHATSFRSFVRSRS